MTATVGYGVLFYTFGVVLGRMTDELGWSNAVVSAGVSVGLVSAGVVAPSVGRRIDQRGAREIMATGSCVGAAGVALWASTSSIPVYLIAWIVIGVGMGMSLYEPAFAAIARHAPRNRRQAVMAITLAGGLASTIFIPLTEALVHRWDWRPTLLVLATGYAALAVPLHLTAIPAHGKVLGAVDGSSTQPRPSRVDEHDTATNTPLAPMGEPPTLAASATLRRLVLAVALTRAAGVAVGSHLVTFLVVTGRSPAAAATIAAGLGAAKFGGRLAAGLAARRLPVWRLFVSAFVLQAVGLVLPLLGPAAGDAVMIVLFGAGSGATTVIIPLYIAELFGIRGFGLTSGRVYRISSLSAAAAPLLFGVIVTVTASYLTAWTALAASCLTAAVVLPRPRHGPGPR